MAIDWEKYGQLNRIGLADFHCHTPFCDGLDTAEDMVLAAIDKGMKAIGFSGHCHTLFDESYCMVGDQVDEYRNEINRLKKKYDGQIDVLCGIEQDCLAGRPEADWDYVIGSVHYMWCGDDWVPVDENEEITAEAIKKYFGGDPYAYAEKYYEVLATVADVTGADIIGHFDIVCKFNHGGDGDGEGMFFDENHPRYVAAWQKAADELVKKGIPFEINTSPLSRKKRTQPYPRKEIREYIRSKGGRFIFSSDSHTVESLGYPFEE